jgi:hypothetical protein
MTTKRARGGVLAACTVVGLLLTLVFAGEQGAGAATPTSSIPASPTPPGPSQSTTYAPVASQFNLTISPTRLNVGPDSIGKPQTILAVNRGEASIHVTVSARSFTGSAEGALDFSTDAPYSAAKWVDIQSAGFDLAPGASRNVVITITQPANADLGDHQVAIVFLIPAGTNGANIKVNRGIAIPLYITVPGAIDTTTRLTGLSAPVFSAGGPIAITAVITNDGTVHRDFRGTTALSISGAGTTTFPDFTVIRGGTRNISAVWSPPLFCICSLKVAVSNAGASVSTRTVQVVVFPVALALWIVGGLLLAVASLLIVRRSRRLRRVALAPHVLVRGVE